jgi:hypothetical protein
LIKFAQGTAPTAVLGINQIRTVITRITWAAPFPRIAAIALAPRHPDRAADIVGAEGEAAAAVVKAALIDRKGVLRTALSCAKVAFRIIYAAL